MSDYDTFPLNHFLRHGRTLPFDGQLTVYSGHVPALVSGNGSEYYRMTKQIGLNMQKHVHQQKKINEEGPPEDYRQHLPWSDMLALAELYNKVSKDMFIMRRQVLNGADALQRVKWLKGDCSQSEGLRAVHFSHKAVSEGNQAYRGAIHRGTIARQFLNMWHRTCEYTPVKDETISDVVPPEVAAEVAERIAVTAATSSSAPTPAPTAKKTTSSKAKKKKKSNTRGYIRLPNFSKEIDQPAEWFQI